MAGINPAMTQWQRPSHQPTILAGCGKTPCRIRHRFDFLRSEQARRERLSDARAGSSERSPGRLRQPGGDGAAGSSTAPDPPAGERGAGALVARLRSDLLLDRTALDPPEQLLRALLLQAFFTVRSERAIDGA